jgi:hypothetical protein
MKKSATLLLALFTTLSAQASSPNIVVTCTSTSFDDIRRIEIVETDLTAQWVMIETKPNGDEVFSPVFNDKELRSNEIPALTSWNGYTRRLVRNGKNDWSITAYDECGGGVSFASCTDQL